MEQVGEATAGGIGAIVSVSSLYWLTSTKVRLQAQKKKKNVSKSDPSQEVAYKGAVDCLQKTWKSDGLPGLYAGIDSALFKGFWTNFTFYFCFSALNPVFRPKNGPKPGFLNSMIHGICAGTCVQLIMAPIDIINTRTIVAKKEGAKFWDIVQRIYREKGVAGFWGGIVPALVLTLNPGITNVVRNYLMPSDPNRKLSPSQNFWIGAVSKATASLISYPIVVTKVRMQLESSKQTTPNGQRAPESSSTASVFTNIIREEGVGGLYKGCELQVLIAVLKEAILNMVRLEINTKIMKLFRLLAKTNKKPKH